jgi:hypothetical protein
VEMAEGNIPTSCGDHMPALSHMREKPEQEPGDKVVLAFDGDGTRESPLHRNGPHGSQPVSSFPWPGAARRVGGSRACRLDQIWRRGLCHSPHPYREIHLELRCVLAHAYPLDGSPPPWMDHLEAAPVKWFDPSAASG